MKKLNQLHNKLLWIFCLALSSCAYSVHQVQVSDFRPYAPIESGEIIKASTNQKVILGFVKDTNYVNEAYTQLLNQCPNREISSITTQFYTELGFFSWNNKILLQGICRKPKS